MHHRDEKGLGLKLSSDSSQGTTMFPSVVTCLLLIKNFFQNSCNHLWAQADLQHGQNWTKRTSIHPDLRKIPIYLKARQHLLMWIHF